MLASITVIDSVGLESKNFLHGFCICMKPSALGTFDHFPLWHHRDTLYAQNNMRFLSEKVGEEPLFLCKSFCLVTFEPLCLVLGYSGD